MVTLVTGVEVEVEIPVTNPVFLNVPENQLLVLPVAGPSGTDGTDGLPGAPGEDADDIPDMTLYFENGLI